MMTKKENIIVIYKEIAETSKIFRGVNEVRYEMSPVMIGDVLDWYFGTNNNFTSTALNGNVYKILKLWILKRQPIVDQSDECIDFIYGLIKQYDRSNRGKTTQSK